MLPIKIGLIGVGHLGKIHLRLLQEIPDFEVIGFYDVSDHTSAMVATEFGVKAFPSADSLIACCDAIDLVTPTMFHYHDAVKVLRHQRHLFVEKPITSNTEEASGLQTLAEEARVKVQVGHVERFNPAFLAAQQLALRPMFIETHRLAEFNPRGTDVPVVMDLMIHDIDIMLHVVKSNVKKISASGVAVISDSPDIANARIEFDNGCIANLTASRISMKNMRKTRLFQRDGYIAIDFLNKQLEVLSLHEMQGEPGPLDMVLEIGDNRPARKIQFNAPQVQPGNAIKMELEHFARSVKQDQPEAVTLADGLKALQLAEQIVEKVNKNMTA